MRKIGLFSVVLVVLLLSACGGTGQPAATDMPELSGRVSVAGSTKHPKVQIDIQGGGSSVGVKSAGEGTADIGTVSREVKAEEMQQFPDLKVHTIALDGIAIVVNRNVSVAGLTKDQVRGIFAGQITNWKEVGGADAPILVVSREEGSGTRTAFEELVMGKDTPIAATALLQPSNGAVRTTVTTTPDSVGYLSFGYLDSSVTALTIEGVEPTTENVLNKNYPISRPLNMLTKGEPAGVVKAWLDWILGPDGQRVVADEHYIPVR